MSVNKAKDYFSGKSGKRLNCGQSILSAFQEKFPLPAETMASFSEYGGGKAPEGYCGALYAAKVILKEHSPESLSDLERTFTMLAGAVKCKEI